MILDEVQLVYSVQASKSVLRMGWAVPVIFPLARLRRRQSRAQSKVAFTHSRLRAINHYQKGSLSYKPERKEGVDVQHTPGALQGMGRSPKNWIYCIFDIR